jgi:uncharacterized protein
MIRDIESRDLREILEINEASVKYLSPLDPKRIEQLQRESNYHKLIEKDGEIAAFILAFNQMADYDSPNYLWFKERYPSFLYIDRIVVQNKFRRLGLADELYNDIIIFAYKNKYAFLTCEVDIDPPNTVSLRFHEKHKFIQVGTQFPYNGSKQVSLRERKIT